MAGFGGAARKVGSSRDTRAGPGRVVAHTGQWEACVEVERLADLETRLGARAYAALDVIGIDEAQFMPDLLDFCLRAADRDGKRVVVAGLDGDFLRQPFGQITELLPIADSVDKILAQCDYCGAPAPFTSRTVESKETYLVGGSESYRPVCRFHYLEGLKARDSTGKD